MSRVAAALINEGVSESVAQAIDHGFNSHTYRRNICSESAPLRAKLRLHSARVARIANPRR